METCIKLLPVYIMAKAKVLRMNDGQCSPYCHDFSKVDEKRPLYSEMFEDCAKLSTQPVKL